MRLHGIERVNTVKITRKFNAKHIRSQLIALSTDQMCLIGKQNKTRPTKTDLSLFWRPVIFDLRNMKKFESIFEIRDVQSFRKVLFESSFYPAAFLKHLYVHFREGSPMYIRFPIF